jgi:hypothetical protein
VAVFVQADLLDWEGYMQEEDQAVQAQVQVGLVELGQEGL